MDASHTAEDLRREYASLKALLPDGHILVIDDALYNDILYFVSDLVKNEGYGFSLILPYHLGMAAMAKSLGQARVILEAAGNVDS